MTCSDIHIVFLLLQYLFNDRIREVGGIKKKKALRNNTDCLSYLDIKECIKNNCMETEKKNNTLCVFWGKYIVFLSKPDDVLC